MADIIAPFIYTWDTLTSWSEKLIYRMLSMSGAKQETLDHYKQAVIDKANGINIADEAFTPPITILGFNFKSAKMVLMWIIFIVGLFVAYKVYKLYKQK
jgi:hypothetical protein